MGNQTSSNITQIFPTMPRTVFFPGNLVTGNLIIECKDVVEYSCISLRLVGELKQTYMVAQGNNHGLVSTMVNNNQFVRREVTTPISDVGCTIIGSTTRKGTYRLAKGSHNYEWAFVLPPSLLPSADIVSARGGSQEQTVQIFYYVTAQVMVEGKSAKQGSIPIHILFPIPESMWSRPSAISKPFNLDLTACFCCERGSIVGSAGMSKTIVALDRDSLAYSVQIDATKSSDPVENVTVSLIACCNIKSGNLPTSFQVVIFSQKVRCNIQAGKTGVANGLLQLGANRPPTIQSSLVDINYKCRFAFDFDFSANTQCEVDIYVAHSVDMTNTTAQLSQMNQQVRSSHIEVPNLLNPLHQQYRPAALQSMQMQPQYQQQQQPQQQFQQPPLPPQHQGGSGMWGSQSQSQFQQPGFAAPAPAPYYGGPQNQQQGPLPPNNNYGNNQQQQQPGATWGQQQQPQQQQQQFQQQPNAAFYAPPQQRPDQYNANNFDQSQQQQYSAQYQQQQNQQFAGIAAFPSQQLVMQAQQAQ